MNKNSIKKIFEPLKLNNLTLRNRLLRSATWEGIASEDGSINQKKKMSFFNKRLTQNYKKISWCTYCLNRIKCLNKNYYIKNSERMRMDLLSEERLFKNYFDIHNLKDELYSKDSKENFKDLERSHLRSSKCKI